MKSKSIIIAADIPFSRLSKLIKETCSIKGVGGYKIGFELGLEKGLPQIAHEIRKYTKLPIIYDHQKAANDIPEFGKKFAGVCKKGGVDMVILFPFAGPKTEREWIRACKEEGLGVIVGGEMTHDQFSQEEGGYISRESSDEIYEIAAKEGVVDFVVPGNKIERITHYKKLLDKMLGNNSFVFYSPGFITQKGEVSEYAKVAGNFWHAIVGRGITEADNIKKTTEMLTAHI